MAPNIKMITAAILASHATAAPTLPSGVYRQWSADAITPQTDNTAITTGWTDSVGGINLAQATGGKQPLYRTSALGGKPGVQFTGAQYFANVDSALKAVCDTKNFTVYILADKIQANSNGTLFGNASAGNSFMFQGNGSVVGRSGLVGLQAPYTDTVTPISIGYTTSSTAVYSSQSGSGLERAYFNGTCATSNTAAFSATGYAADLQFCIGVRNTADSASWYAKAYVYEVIVWNRCLSPGEMMQVEKWARNKYSLTLPWANLPRMYHFDGDSLTVGVSTATIPSSYPYQTAQHLGLTYGQWAMHAVGGITTQDMAGNAATTTKYDDMAAVITATGKPVRLLAWEWYNEKNTGRTASAYSDMVAYCSKVKTAFTSQGIKICLGSSTGYTGDATDPYSSVRGAYNAQLDTNNASMADAYVAIHTDTNIGSSGAYAANSATYWGGDGVHLNASGRTVLAGLMNVGADAINS